MISKNYSDFLVDTNDKIYEFEIDSRGLNKALVAAKLKREWDAAIIV